MMKAAEVWQKCFGTRRGSTTMNLHLDNNQINNTGCLVWAVNLREMQQLTSMRVSFRGNPEISGEAWAVWLEAVGNLRRLRNVTLVSLRRRTIEASPKALKGVVGHLRELYLASASRAPQGGSFRVQYIGRSTQPAAAAEISRSGCCR